MRARNAVFAVFAAFLVLLMSAGSEAVSTRKIDRVRNKGVLESTDFQIIDNFVGEAVRELVQTRDFTSISKIRNVISLRSGSAEASAEAQYRAQFFDSAFKHISAAFDRAGELTPENVKFKVMLNLLILVDNLESARLVDLALEKLTDENTVIRYWAVHCVTNPSIVKQLNSAQGGNSSVARKIAEQLEKLVGNASPEITALMAEFAAKVQIPEGEDLLLQIADMRISKYAAWSVECELLDASILELLCERLSSAGSPRAAVARRFAQLYSYAIQRYVSGRDSLNDAQKKRLASVLVETEDKCVGRLFGMRQSIVKKAVEQNDYIALLQEHSRLLGDQTRAGRLGLKLNFDYGMAGDGSKRITPLTLPQQPKP